MNILKSLSFYTISNVFTKGIALVSVIMLTNIFSIENYGVITLSNTYLALFMTLFAFGIDAGIQRFYVEIKEIEKRKILFGYVLAVALILNIVTFIICCSLYFITDIFKEIPKSIFLITILIGSIKGFQNIGLAIIRIKEMAKEYTIANMLISLTDVILIYIVIYIFKNGILSRFIILLIVNIISLFIIYFYTKDEIKFNMNRFKEKEILDRFISYCTPLLLLPIVSWLLTSIDKVMVSKLLNMKEVGIYGFGNGIVSNLSIIVTSFLMAYSPIFLKNYDNRKLILEINDAFIALYMGLLIVFLGFSEFLVKLVFKNPDYYISIKLFPIMATGTLILAVYSLHSTILSYNFKTKFILYISVISGFSNIFLSYILIKNIGIIGAALSSVAVLCIQLFLTFYFVSKINYKPVSYYKLGLNFLIYIVFSAFFYMNNLSLEVIVFFVYIFINKNEFLKILKKVRGNKI